MHVCDVESQKARPPIALQNVGSAAHEAPQVAATSAVLTVSLAASWASATLASSVLEGPLQAFNAKRAKVSPANAEAERRCDCGMVFHSYVTARMRRKPRPSAWVRPVRARAFGNNPLTGCDLFDEVRV